MFYLLRNAEVFAPEPLGIRDILVCAGKIVKIGEKLAELDSSLQVQKRDLQGRRVTYIVSNPIYFRSFSCQ